MSTALALVRSVEVSPLDRLARVANDAHRDFCQNAVVAGRALLEAKKIIKQDGGSWLAWITENCEFSQRTAQVYMQCARDPQRAADSIRQALSSGRSRFENCTGDVEYYTPAPIIEAVHAVLGKINLDPASCAKANEVVRAERFFTLDDDALTLDWVAPTLFMNPPYSRGEISAFCEKLVLHIQVGDVGAAVVLVNAAAGTQWFTTLSGAAAAICIHSNRVQFSRPEGPSESSPLGTALFYFGAHPDNFRRVFQTFGKVWVPATPSSADPGQSLPGATVETERDPIRPESGTPTLPQERRSAGWEGITLAEFRAAPTGSADSPVTSLGKAH